MLFYLLSFSVCNFKSLHIVRPINYYLFIYDNYGNLYKKLWVKLFNVLLNESLNELRL